MSVAVASGSPPRFERPRELFELPPGTDYLAMAPDGQRFVAVYGAGGDKAARELDVVLNWFVDLKARVPPPEG